MSDIAGRFASTKREWDAEPAANSSGRYSAWAQVPSGFLLCSLAPGRTEAARHASDHEEGAG